LISPILSNCALSIIEERYQEGPFYTVRYADDFVLFGTGSLTRAEGEKALLATLLQTMGLTLSEKKTKITPLSEPFEFIGYEFSQSNAVSPDLSGVSIPQGKIDRLKSKLYTLVMEFSPEGHFDYLIQEKVDPILRGWGNFHRNTDNALEVFTEIDQFVFELLMEWLKRKFRATSEEVLFWFYRDDDASSIGTTTGPLMFSREFLLPAQVLKAG
jgi:hypothetical protein